MITFRDKHQEFIQMMQTKISIENTHKPSEVEFDSGEKADDELMALLEKKFEELFGPLDDDD